MSENNRTQILTRLRAQCTPWTDAQDLDPDGAVHGAALIYCNVRKVCIVFFPCKELLLSMFHQVLMHASGFAQK